MSLFHYRDTKTSLIHKSDGNYYFAFTLPDRKPELIKRIWGDWPAKEEYSKIRSLTLFVLPAEVEKIKEIPTFLNDLKNLESLSLPIDLIKKIGVFPTGIKSLVLFSPVFNKSDYLEWPSELELKNLIYISIPELVHSFKINFSLMPNLQWIEYDLQSTTNNNIIKELACLKDIRHLIFNHPKAIDIFTPFRNHDILSIELFAGTDKSFHIENLGIFKSLQYLQINNIAAPLDCEMLLDLPKLTELILYNIKKVENIQEILMHRTLQAISVFNCKDAFKDSDKELFKKRFKVEFLT